MSKITVRSMNENDWLAVSAIYQSGMDTNLATFQTECPPYVEWDKSHLHCCRLVAVTEGKVVGWAALSPVSDRCVYSGVAEVSVYVEPNSHGQGIGAALLSELSAAAKKEGIWTLQSGIMQNNVASIRLHEKCGFRTVGYRERIGKDHSGIWHNTVLMELRNDLD